MLLDFQKTQQVFAKRIRQGKKAQCPAGISERRMQVYEDCFHNGIEENIAISFPILKSVIDPKKWERLIRDFYEKHHSKTHLFSEIPQEFLTYIVQEHQGIIKLPFLTELTHYEWMRYALLTASGNAFPCCDENTALQTANNIMKNNSLLTLSPLVEIVAYHYPVHKINPDYMPRELEQGEYFFCVYRNQQGSTNYIEVNAVGCRFLQILKQADLSFDQIIEQTTGFSGGISFSEYQSFLSLLLRKGVVLANI